MALPLLGCTWLVSFHTLPCDAGVCGDGGATPNDVDRIPDGEPPPDTGVVTVQPPRDSMATDTTVPVDSTVLPESAPPPDTAVPDTTVAPDTSMPVDGYVNPCVGRADGTSLSATDDNARCCGQQPVETTSDSNCGVCGIKCNTAAGQSCGLIDGHYLCLNCTSNADCWSNCCASSVSPAHCAADDCSTGACATGSGGAANPCASYPGSPHCTIDGVGYCSY